jgi:hypothetical protein
MTPYGYHNSEINHMSGDDRRNAREAIRQAKLARQRAREETAGVAPEGSVTQPGVWHRLLGRAQHLAPRSYRRHLRAHSQ